MLSAHTQAKEEEMTQRGETEREWDGEKCGWTIVLKSYLLVLGAEKAEFLLQMKLTAAVFQYFIVICVMIY